MTERVSGAPREPATLLLRKVARILDCFVPHNKELSLSQVQRLTELPMSTTYRMVQGLVAEGFLLRQDNVYRIGWVVGRWGAAVSEGSDLLKSAQPVLERLRDETGETASLLVREGLERVCVAFALSRQPVMGTTYIGEVLPLQGGASSKVLLAFDEEATRRVLDRGLQRYTLRTVVDEDRFLAELTAIRDKGYGLSREEVRAGVASISSPVFDGSGAVVAALNLGIPTQRATRPYQNSFIDAVRDAADEISGDLGWTDSCWDGPSKAVASGRRPDSLANAPSARSGLRVASAAQDKR